MIPLVMKSEVEGAKEDFVVRVARPGCPNDDDAQWHDAADGPALRHGGASVRVPGYARDQMAGDVLLVSPSRGTVQRMIRASSPHNFFLVTEQCDQLCLMCSQPPKKTHQDQFAHFRQAVLLAPQGARITITGGEPTLHKDGLFDLLALAHRERRDIHFQILSNAQHFAPDDIAFLSSGPCQNVLWGIPLYAGDPAVHDHVVGKEGAYDQLERGLAILASAGAAIELRTVLLQANARELVSTANFIANNVSFILRWAIMQLESIGFAKNRWGELFFDNSVDFGPVAEAIDVARSGGIEPLLYNFPLCTIPSSYRRFARPAISDWKRKYLAQCACCPIQDHCGGFFEWYPETDGFERIGLQ